MNDSQPQTVEFSRKTQQVLMKLLEGSEPVVLDVSPIGDIDLSGLQIFIALIKEAAARKKTVRFTGRISEGFHRLLLTTGISEDHCETGEDLESLVRAVC